MRVSYVDDTGTPYVGVSAIAAEIGCAQMTARRMCAAGRIEGVLRLGPEFRPPYGQWIAPMPLRVRSHEVKRRGRGRPIEFDADSDGHTNMGYAIYLDGLAARLGITELRARQLCEAQRVWGAMRGRGSIWTVPSPPIIDGQWVVRLPREGEYGDFINRRVRAEVLNHNDEGAFG